MEIVKIPDGQTEESFRKVKINNVKATIETFGCILQDNDYFSNNSQTTVLAIQLQLQSLLEKLEGKM